MKFFLSFFVMICFYGCSDIDHADLIKNYMKLYLMLDQDQYSITCTKIDDEVDFSGMWCIESKAEIFVPKGITSQFSYKSDADYYIKEVYQLTGQRADGYILYQNDYVDQYRCQDKGVCSVAMLAKKGGRKVYIFIYKL